MLRYQGHQPPFINKSFLEEMETDDKLLEKLPVKPVFSSKNVIGLPVFLMEIVVINLTDKLGRI